MPEGVPDEYDDKRIASSAMTIIDVNPWAYAQGEGVKN